MSGSRIDIPPGSGPTALSRREFLQKAGFGLAGVVAGVVATRLLGPGGEPVEKVLITYPEHADLRIANLKDLKVGEPVLFEYPLKGQQNMLVKLGKPAHEGAGPDGDIVAFSAFCSHMGIPLVGAFKPEMGLIGPCPGHLSTFDLARSGMGVMGKATENLPQIALAVREGGEIYATGSYGLIYGYRDNLRDGTAVKGGRKG